MHTFPDVDTLMVCDMSSDIFSTVRDYSKFDLIYAGAQKNIGPAGATLVVIKKEILGKTGRNLPSYMNYTEHIAAESMFNTPPVFAVYATLLTLQYLEANGGIEGAEARNYEKARILYEEIDQNPLYLGHAAVEDRSKMNITFRLTDESLTEKFDKATKEAGISGLGGHRSVGGYRASIYNAMPLESVQILVNVMKSFK